MHTNGLCGNPVHGTASKRCHARAGNTAGRYSRALAALRERQETKIHLGLARIRGVLRRLGDPQESFACVHVAGTNGKGSVCAMLDSVLREAGHRVGLYTSPHLQDVRERVRVDGRAATKAAFARAVERVLRAEREPLTFFELVTAAAFVRFAEAKVRIAVLETGLGGRLDATNVVRRPLACLVPGVDLDHTDWLGDRLDLIAREKAGIFKRGCPAITAETKPRALRVMRRVATERGAPWRELGARHGVRCVRVDWRRGRQWLRLRKGPAFSLRLLGPAQPRNAALVLEAVRVLREAGWSVPEAAVRRGLSKVRWPGRFEVVRLGSRTLILDGAHNPQAMDHFCRALAASPWARVPKVFILGMLADKDHRTMLKRLAPHVAKAVAVRPPSPRALEPGRLASELAAAAPRARISVTGEPEQALEAWRANGAPVACVVGSFYLVGAVRNLLSLSRPRRERAGVNSSLSRLRRERAGVRVH